MYLALYIYKVTKYEDENIISRSILFYVISIGVSIFCIEAAQIMHIFNGNHYSILDYIQIVINGLSSALFMYIFLSMSLGWSI